MSRARILADYVSSGDELADKAPLASPAFTGTPTGITAAHLEAGVLPSDVTGGSGLTALGTVATGNLSNTAIVYPAGHVIQTKSKQLSGVYNSYSNNTPTPISGFNVSMPVRSASSKILLLLVLTGTGKQTGNTTIGVKLIESTTSLDVKLTDVTGYTADTSTSYSDITLSYEHTHGQSVGTTLTYTPKLYSSENTSSVSVGNYWSGNNNIQIITIFEVMQ